MSDNDNKPEEEQKKRSVTISPVAVVVFERKSTGEVERVQVNRDVYSVTDAIGRKLSELGGKEGMDDTLVSVHSVEDTGKSDPIPEGESAWEGEYLVAGLSVEKMTIPDAMTELAKAIIPNDAAMKGVERLAEQLFLRSRLDGFVFIGTFDGQPAVIPLISSFKAQTPECFAMLYRQLHVQAENLKAWVSHKFPEIAKDTNWTGESKADSPSGLVLPSGVPVESRMPPRQLPKLQFKPSCGRSCKSRK